MTAKRLKMLSKLVYDHAFLLLDKLAELSGEDAGKVATDTQQAFERSLSCEVEPE